MPDLAKFLQEMGDGEVTSRTFDQAKFEDDLTDDGVNIGGDDEDEGEQEPAEQQPQQPEPPAAPASDEPTAKDYERIYAEQSRQTLNQLQQFVEQKLSQHQPAPQAQQPQFEDPMVRLHREVEELKQKQEQANARAKSAAEKLFKQEFERSVAAIKEQYPDIHEFIPAERMEHAYREAVKHEAFDTDWKGEISRTYKLLSHDKYFKAHGKGEDEVSQKRAEKREKSSAISAGGAKYQAPSKKLDPNSPTYHKDKQAAFFADLAGG